MDIMDKGFVPYSNDEYMATSYRESLSELLFYSFCKNIFSTINADWDLPRLKLLQFCRLLLHIMQELVMQGQKQNLYYTSSCYKEQGSNTSVSKQNVRFLQNLVDRLL